MKIQTRTWVADVTFLIHNTVMKRNVSLPALQQQDTNIEQQRIVTKLGSAKLIPVANVHTHSESGYRSKKSQKTEIELSADHLPITIELGCSVNMIDSGCRTYINFEKADYETNREISFAPV